MSVQIVPPTPAPPVKSGFVRHQFVLVLGKSDLEEELKKLSCTIPEYLMFYFGIGYLYAEKVMSGDYHAWHVWYDYAEGELEKLMENSEENP